MQVLPPASASEGSVADQREESPSSEERTYAADGLVTGPGAAWPGPRCGKSAFLPLCLRPFIML